MKKKTYQQPRVGILEVKAADIICTSRRRTEELTEDEFIWYEDASGSSTEKLSEDDFGW